MGFDGVGHHSHLRIDHLWRDGALRHRMRCQESEPSRVAVTTNRARVTSTSRNRTSRCGHGSWSSRRSPSNVERSLCEHVTLQAIREATPDTRRRWIRWTAAIGALLVAVGTIVVVTTSSAAAPVFTKAQAIADCAYGYRIPNIFQTRPPGVDVVGNAAAVAFVSRERVALCVTGIGSTPEVGSTELSFVETISRGASLQVMFLTNDDWKNYWALLYAGRSVTRVQVATAWGAARSIYVGSGAWLVDAPFRVPVSTVNSLPMDASLWAGQALGFGQRGLLVASIPVRFCVHQTFTNLNHCQGP